MQIRTRVGLFKLRNQPGSAHLSIMRVLSKSAWRVAVLKDPSLEGPLAEWHKIALHARWASIVDVKRVYPHADYVAPYTVFNIRGNNYRLVVKIEYQRSMIFIKHLLTHDEYMRNGWKK